MSGRVGPRSVAWNLQAMGAGAGGNAGTYGVDAPEVGVAGLQRHRVRERGGCVAGVAGPDGISFLREDGDAVGVGVFGPPREDDAPFDGGIVGRRDDGEARPAPRFRDGARALESVRARRVAR